jgi:PhnB protein
MEPTLTPKLAPYLLARDARGLVRFIERAMDGKLSYEVSDPEGRLSHAEVRVSDSLLMLAETPPHRPQFPAMLHLYVADADASYRRALDAGATSVREPEDAGDGMHRGGVRDTWGNEWWFSSPAKSDQ